MATNCYPLFSSFYNSHPISPLFLAKSYPLFLCLFLTVGASSFGLAQNMTNNNTWSYTASKNFHLEQLIEHQFLQALHQLA